MRGGQFRDTVPHDRLTRLCAAMTDALEANPEYDKGGDKAIIFINGMGDDGQKRGGIQTHGYGDEGDLDAATTDAMVDLFIHMKAMFNSVGKELTIVPFPGEG